MNKPTVEQESFYWWNKLYILGKKKKKIHLLFFSFPNFHVFQQGQEKKKRERSQSTPIKQ